MISVIITTLKRPPSLLKAIISVINQTFEDWELIIVNDSSNPLSITIDERVKVINNGKNLGGTKSLNIGMNYAKGEYIAILDDDDEWVSKDKLEKQVKFLEENPDYIAVGTEIEGSCCSGKVDLVGTPFAHSSILFRKGLRYNEKLKRAKDLDLILRLSKFGKIEILRDCFIKYAVSNDLNKKIKDCHWHRKVVLMHKDFPNWFKVYKDLWLREIKLRQYGSISALRKNGGEHAK